MKNAREISNFPDEINYEWPNLNVTQNECVIESTMRCITHQHPPHVSNPICLLWPTTLCRDTLKVSLFVTSPNKVDALSSSPSTSESENDENEKERIVSQLKSKRKEKEWKKDFKKLAKSKRERKKFALMGQRKTKCLGEF